MNKIMPNSINSIDHHSNQSQLQYFSLQQKNMTR
uniref:Uncharacterized protein n=1 Tax=Cucumis melo TaxID=3656 RepID=A0A9I9EIG9_CUCME